MLYFFSLIFGIYISLIQLLLFREVFSVFQGIDLSIGIYAACSFLFFATGVYIFNLINFSKHPKKSVFISTFLVIVFSFLSLMFIWNIRNLLHVPIGSGISLKSTVLFIVVALACINLLEGILFRFIILLTKFEKPKLYSLKKSVQCMGIGIILGCLAYSLLLFHSLAIEILLLSNVLLLVGLLILTTKNKNILILLFAFVIFGAFLFSDTSLKFDKYLFNKNFPNAEIEEYKYSHYGQVVLLQKNKEYSILSNNILLFSSPNKEILHSQNFVHIPILHHQDPKNILIIGGAAKYLQMVLEYNIDNVDYVEIDNSVVEIIQRTFSHLERVFNDKRLNIYNTNAEDFIKQSKSKYDLILIGLPAPINLYLNNYYTKEFFELGKKALNNSGFLALALPGKKVFSPLVTSELNASVFEALRQNFAFVRAVPGDQNILIASNHEMPYRMFIKQRLFKVKDSSLLLSKHYLDDKMDTAKTNWLMSEVEKTIQNENLLNTKNNPQAAMFTLFYKQSEFSPYLSIFLDKTARFSYLILFCIVWIFFLSKSIYKTTSFVSGATMLWVNFTAIFILQSYSGQVLSQLGTISAISIFGAIVGNILADTLKKYVPLNKKNFFAELFFLLIIIIWFFVLKFGYANLMSVYILLFIAGINFGVEFSYLIKISNLYHNKNESKLKIFLYAAYGAWAASLIGGGFLILVWGMEKSILFIVALKFLIFCRWADLNKRGL